MAVSDRVVDGVGLTEIAQGGSWVIFIVEVKQRDIVGNIRNARDVAIFAVHIQRGKVEVERAVIFSGYKAVPVAQPQVASCQKLGRIAAFFKIGECYSSIWYRLLVFFLRRPYRAFVR